MIHNVSGYERFLYASVFEQNNGTQLSVLSALARANTDPWEEAARLAVMPRTDAESALASILERISDQNWTHAEVHAIAARLVNLLVPENESSRTAPGAATSGEADRSVFWLVWLLFAIAVSVSSPRNHPTTPDAVPSSNATSSSAASAPGGRISGSD
jgi:hypothetical protein